MPYMRLRPYNDTWMFEAGIGRAFLRLSPSQTSYRFCLWRNPVYFHIGFSVLVLA